MIGHVLSLLRTPYLPGPTPRSYQCQKSVPARSPSAAAACRRGRWVQFDRDGGESETEERRVKGRLRVARLRLSSAFRVLAVLFRVVLRDDIPELLEHERLSGDRPPDVVHVLSDEFLLKLGAEKIPVIRPHVNADVIDAVYRAVRDEVLALLRRPIRAAAVRVQVHVPRVRAVEALVADPHEVVRIDLLERRARVFDPPLHGEDG
eukprot:31383-Pelagococcus_subviridis.AAC.6